MVPGDPVSVYVLWLRAQGLGGSVLGAVKRQLVGHFHGTQTPDGAASKALRTDECAGFTAGRLFAMARCLVCAGATQALAWHQLVVKCVCGL